MYVCGTMPMWVWQCRKNKKERTEESWNGRLRAVNKIFVCFAHFYDSSSLSPVLFLVIILLYKIVWWVGSYIVEPNVIPGVHPLISKECQGRQPGSNNTEMWMSSYWTWAHFYIFFYKKMYKLHSNLLHNKHITLLFYECVICFIYICRFSMKNNTILKASSSFCKQNNLSHIYSLSWNDELVICVLCVLSNVRPMKNKEGNWTKRLRIRKSSNDDDDVAKYCHKKHFGGSIIPSSATDWFISFLIEHDRRKFTQRKKNKRFAD